MSVDRPYFPTTEEEELEQAVAIASELIDLLPFLGEKLHPQQKRAWPRVGVYEAGGDEIHGIPQEIELLCEAIVTCLLADCYFDMEALSSEVAPFLAPRAKPQLH